MINNDVLRSVRFMLQLGDRELAAIGKLGGADVTGDQVRDFLRRDDEPGYQVCNNRVMGGFLDGLIVHLRGRDDTRPARPVDTDITNNTVLKKLRVAFKLQEDDLAAMMKASGFEVSRPELSALFRNPTHKNFRPCGDQFLRAFLKALTGRVRR